MLLFILEESERSKNDLVAILGTENLLNNILNGQEKINTEQARKLGEFFHVEASLFME
jgi:HTH-type transcriptional regulator / antitoxin HigA